MGEWMLLPHRLTKLYSSTRVVLELGMPFLFTVLVILAAVINVASTRFKPDKGIGRFGAPEEKKGGGGGGGGKQLPESQSWRRHFVACFMLTMPGTSRNYQSTKEDDGGDRGRVRGVGPHRIGGQD